MPTTRRLELKCDTTKNGDMTDVMNRRKEIENKLYPLRINERIVILVPEHKRDEEYRQKWIAKNLEPQKIVCNSTGNTSVIKEDELRKLVDQHGMDMNRISREIGCSKTSVYHAVKKYGLREVYNEQDDRSYQQTCKK